MINFNGAGLLAEAMASVEFTLNKPDYKKMQQEMSVVGLLVGVSGLVDWNQKVTEVWKKSLQHIHTRTHSYLSWKSLVSVWRVSRLATCCGLSVCFIPEGHCKGNMKHRIRSFVKVFRFFNVLVCGGIFELYLKRLDISNTGAVLTLPPTVDPGALPQVSASKVYLVTKRPWRSPCHIPSPAAISQTPWWGHLLLVSHLLYPLHIALLARRIHFLQK